MPSDSPVSFRLSAAQVDFIEAHARLTLAASERDTAISRHRNAEQYFRGAWERMSKGEQNAVNEAFAALNEPETVS
jgi:hypothetical protein